MKPKSTKYLSNSKGYLIGYIADDGDIIISLVDGTICIKEEQAMKHINRCFKYRWDGKWNLIPMKMVIEDGRLIEGDYIYKYLTNKNIE